MGYLLRFTWPYLVIRAISAEEDIDHSDDENADAVDISDVPEVTLGCKVGNVIEMMGKEWRIENVIF